MSASLTKRMVASYGWRYAKHGPVYKTLALEKFRIPFDRSTDQVVVKMLAAPVHKHDKNMVEGCYGLAPAAFPAVAGVEGVGILEEVGTLAGQKIGVKEGDLVWINKQNVGTWATRIVTSVDNVDVVPNRPDVDIELLACMSIYHTAHHLLNDYAHIEPGDVILQTGATSAVSQICHAYARAKGAKLFVTMQRGRTEHDALVGRFKGCGAFGVLPYAYIKTNYMKRLLSDIPPPKLMLNHTGGRWSAHLLKHLGENGVCVNYGSAVGKPMQIPNLDLITKNIQIKGFFLPATQAKMSREARMRIHQKTIENIEIAQGQALFRAQRFKLECDSRFAFANCWDAPYTSRKSILRMVGEYGEWRRPRPEPIVYQMGRAVWEDSLQEAWECSGASDTPQSMKYYTPFNDFHSVYNEAQQSREVGHREVWFRRPNAPRHHASTEKQ